MPCKPGHHFSLQHLLTRGQELLLQILRLRPTDRDHLCLRQKPLHQDRAQQYRRLLVTGPGHQLLFRTWLYQISQIRAAYLCVLAQTPLQATMTGTRLTVVTTLQSVQTAVTTSLARAMSVTLSFDHLNFKVGRLTVRSMTHGFEWPASLASTPDIQTSSFSLI